jgi:hypothetical protein
MLYGYFYKTEAESSRACQHIIIVKWLNSPIAHRRRNVKSAVPGCALRLSAAPPTTIVIAYPGPALRMFEHDFLLTLHMPSANRISRYIGIWKFDESVRRCGLIPGNAAEKPVANKI